MLAERLKPYDELARAVAERLPKDCPLVTLEEEIRAGGMGMLLIDALARMGALSGRNYHIMATDDCFGIQEVSEPIYKTMGIDAQSVAETVRDICPILQKGSF
jgi:deoxyxylulose-5-phosphate synthase